MTLGTKLYVSGIIGAGIVALVPEIPRFGVQHPVKFFLYGILAALAARMKVKLPGIEGNISVLFVLLLIGIVELTLPETLAIAIGSVLIQSFFGAERRPRLIQLGFNMASLLVAVRLAAAAYSFPTLQQFHAPISFRLATAAVVFFLANTFPVAIVIAL